MKWPMKRKLQAFVALLSSFALMLCAVSARADEEKDRLEGATSTLQNQLSAINQDMLAISNEISTTEMQIEITNGEILMRPATSACWKCCFHQKTWRTF